MSKLRIVHYPHPALRHPTVPIKFVDKALRLQVGEMFERMYDAKGLGLAAPQVVLPYQLIVMNTTGKPGEREHEKVYLNPQIVERKGTMDGEEGCLSLPGLFVSVRRAKKVTLEAFDLEGRRIELETDVPLESRALQHEVDHLNGILFIDKFSTLSKLANARTVSAFTSKYKKLQQLGDMPSDVDAHRLLKELSNQLIEANSSVPAPTVDPSSDKIFVG